MMIGNSDMLVHDHLLVIICFLVLVSDSFESLISRFDHNDYSHSKIMSWMEIVCNCLCMCLHGPGLFKSISYTHRNWKKDLGVKCAWDFLNWFFMVFVINADLCQRDRYSDGPKQNEMNVKRSKVVFNVCSCVHEIIFHMIELMVRYGVFYFELHIRFEQVKGCSSSLKLGIKLFSAKC